MAAIPFDALKLANADAVSVADLATKQGLHGLEQRLTIRVGGMLVAAVGVIAAAMRLSPAH